LHYDAIQIGENSLNEKNIQEVLEIEKQADAIHKAALHEAQQIPVETEQEAQTLIENTRAAAEEEARKIVASAQSEEETARILSEAEDKIKRADGLAMKNRDRAVNYVMARVLGRES
jgi:vacuolar-type H+-ATPase subunit H